MPAVPEAKPEKLKTIRNSTDLNAIPCLEIRGPKFSSNFLHSFRSSSAQRKSAKYPVTSGHVNSKGLD